MKCRVLPQLFLVCVVFIIYVRPIEADTYDEELTIKRLNTGQILSKFRFVVTTKDSAGSQYTLFPRIIAEISEKYGINEFHFSLSQGFWRNSEWGVPPQPASPSGALLTATFYGNETSVDDRWNHFVNLLNGIFCTSLLEMVPALTASPLYTTYSTSKKQTSTLLLTRQAALPGESVCTENLTPWRKLLPCKETGLCILLSPEKLYSSSYHSMGIHMTRMTCSDKLESCDNRTRLEFDLDMVTDVDLHLHSLDWSFFSLYGRKIESKCKVADSTRVIYERDPLSSSILDPQKEKKHRGRHYYIYEVNQLANDLFPFNLHNRYKAKLNMAKKMYTSAISGFVLFVYCCIIVFFYFLYMRQNCFSIHSFLGGTDQQSGRIITVIKNHQQHQQTVFYSQIVPWFVQVYFHTIHFTCTSQRSNSKGEGIDAHSELLNYIQAKNRKKPFLLEYNLTLPAESICTFQFYFDKAFLRVTEFPPDANHGMYIPAAKISFIATDEFLINNETVPGSDLHTSYDELSNQKSLRLVSIYGEVLLVSLPVPDFSMPFNVICFVSTAIAMLFGPVHSLTTKILIPISKDDKDLVPKPLLTAALLRAVAFLKAAVRKVSGKGSKVRPKTESVDENVNDLDVSTASSISTETMKENLELDVMKKNL
uniref:GPI transamidase component PIG-T n=1 Tax=Syphacia muris TaxID=451379 RepID=A0A0N5AGZ4_9BILA